MDNISLIIDYPVMVALLGVTIMGATSGMISCYAVLKEQSLLGDAIAHAALPGICLAFLITLNKHPGILMLGAMTTGILGMILITLIIRKSILKEDTALGIILSVFFGIGTLLLTMIQKIPTSRQAGLDTYLFGNAASMLMQDVKIIVVIASIVTVTIFIFWKEFKCVIFDAGHAKSQGVPTLKIELLLTILTVITIVIGLQSVGVILMSALIIAPAIAAKQWQQRLGPMMLLSVFFGSLSSAGGVIISSSIHRLPSGPTIVVLMSAIVLFSLLFSPQGVVIRRIRHQFNRRHIRMDSIITNLYILAQSHSDQTHPHNINTLNVLGGIPHQKLLLKLMADGYIYQHDANQWGLTPQGIAKAITMLPERR
ncbi:MAG: metal ABC transporter permease [Candidatus Marinamargulisbacteria bacterium]